MMSFMQVNWTLLLIYYGLKELKIEAITTLIAEWDQHCYVAAFIARLYWQYNS